MWSVQARHILPGVERPERPEDLKDHDCITFENTLSSQRWIFNIGKAEKSFPIHSRLIVSTAEAATDAAVAGWD